MMYSILVCYFLHSKAFFSLCILFQNFLFRHDEFILALGFHVSLILKLFFFHFERSQRFDGFAHKLIEISEPTNWCGVCASKQQNHQLEWCKLTELCRKSSKSPSPSKQKKKQTNPLNSNQMRERYLNYANEKQQQQ